ncbi:MAG: hypothetical protein JST58_00225 [Bacteroidetes bacterium]|nr:hypothetical protein [Bacteroidota bacterium]
MSEERREDRKSESPEDVNGEGSIGKTVAPEEINKPEIPPSEIKNMEVHHHPEVEKKGVKEYLLEGLMIFVAVTMGFFAENIRENISDHSKEKEYLVNIKKDLVADTSNLNIWIPALQSSINNFDSLISILQQPQPTTRGSEMYYFARLSTRTRLFESNDNTIIELKSSGNFRLIRNLTVLNGLVNFENTKTRYITLNDVANQESELLYPLIGTLFDASIFNQMVITPRSVATVTEKDFSENSKKWFQKPIGNPQLRNYNKDMINQLIYYIHQKRSTFDGEIRLLNTQKQAAVSLIHLLNKEYRLDNE